MSELTDRLDYVDAHADRGSQSGELVSELLDALPAQNAEIREQAKREQYEADCKAACIYCEKKIPFLAGTFDAHSTSRSGWSLCDAHAIRAAWAKAHPEAKL